MGRKLDPITISIRDDGLLEVSQNGKICNGLAYDEMIGQIIALTAHLISKSGYRMMTPEEWAACWPKVDETISQTEGTET